MASKPLLKLFTIIASSALLSQSASAAIFSPPDLNNPIEGRIKQAQQGAWSSFLEDQGKYSNNDTEVAGKWKNGKNKKFKNSGRSGKWKNGKNKSFRNSSGWRNGGFRNGGGWGNGGGFRNGGGWGNVGGVGWGNGGRARVGWGNW